MLMSEWQTWQSPLLEMMSLIQANAYNPPLQDRSEQCEDHGLLVQPNQIYLMITARQTHGTAPLLRATNISNQWFIIIYREVTREPDGQGLDTQHEKNEAEEKPCSPAPYC